MHTVPAIDESTTPGPGSGATDNPQGPQVEIHTDSESDNLQDDTPSTFNTQQLPTDISKTPENGPYQPVPSGGFKKTKIGADNYYRSFATHWYRQYPTIEYSVVCDAVFCFVCRHFKPANNYAENVFTQKGFKNWRKMRENMNQHIDSTSHKDAVAQWGASTQSGSSGAVVAQLSTQAASATQRNRECVASIARGALYCARQDIALRGHREKNPETAKEHGPEESEQDEIFYSSNRGNMQELIHLLKLESKDLSQKMDKLPKNATYTSKDSQNQILQAASKVVLDRIIAEVKGNGGVYSVIADEARDNSCVEKMSVCIRYMHGNSIRERFLGFIDIDALDAHSLSESLRRYVEDDMNLSLKDCIGQSYDGASVMSGRVAGVQQLIRDKSDYPCPYTHCYAHRVNLVLVDVARNVEFVNRTFGLFEAIYAFQSSSTLRHAKFNASQCGETRVLKIPQHSDTRWVSKHKGVTFFKTRYSCVVNALDEICHSRNGMEAAEARGLLRQFKCLEVVFALILFSDLLGLTNSLSTVLQTSTIDYGATTRIIDATIKAIELKRSDAYFDSVWDSALRMACESDIGIPAVTNTIDTSKRIKAAPKHLTDYYTTTTLGSGTNAGSDIDVKASHRREFFEVVDAFLLELKRRFTVNNYILDAATATDPLSRCFLSFELMEEFAVKHAKFGIDIAKLKCQAEVARNMLQPQATGSTRTATSVTSTGLTSEERGLVTGPLNSLAVHAQLLQMAPAFPDLIKFIQLVLCLAVTSATAERSFSAMKRIKTYMRSTMKEQRLSHLAILSIERGLSGIIMNHSPMLIVDKFARMGNRRLSL